MRVWTAVLACSVIVAVAAATADATSFRDAVASASNARSDVYPLTVREEKTPRIHWACSDWNIIVGGEYPQVFHNRMPLRAVNAALRAAAVADQRALIGSVCPRAGPGGLPGPAYYKTDPNIRLISASSVVISALMPADNVPPGANFSYDWAAVTIRVATARQVGITDLFAHPYQGLKALGAAARKRLSARNDCIRQFADPTFFGPTASNYQYFALTTKGLVIGFPSDTAAPLWCGIFSVMLPYSLLRPYLSKLGQELVTGVRQPLMYDPRRGPAR